MRTIADTGKNKNKSNLFFPLLRIQKLANGNLYMGGAKLQILIQICLNSITYWLYMLALRRQSPASLYLCINLRKGLAILLSLAWKSLCRSLWCQDLRAPSFTQVLCLQECATGLTVKKTVFFLSPRQLLYKVKTICMNYNDKTKYLAHNIFQVVESFQQFTDFISRQKTKQKTNKQNYNPTNYISSQSLEKR